MEIEVNITYKLSKEEQAQARKECYSCKSRREVPGNCHIQCVTPDVNMVGSKHGIKKGWFMYPILFDPTWKEKLCDNYSAVSESVSGVSKSSKAQ